MQRYIAAGAPKALAAKVAALRPLTTASDLVDLATRSDWPMEAVARIYHQAGGAFGFDEVRAAAGTLGTGDAFERTAVRRLVEDLLNKQADLTALLLKSADGQADRAVSQFAATHQTALQGVRRTLQEIAASEGGWTFAKLTIANAALRSLAES